jgi:hypothetical protein
MLADVLEATISRCCRVGVRENVLDEVVTVLVAGNVDQWNSRTVVTALTNTIKVVD